jgi:hypothetical protein
VNNNLRVLLSYIHLDYNKELSGLDQPPAANSLFVMRLECFSHHNKHTLNYDYLSPSSLCPKLTTFYSIELTASLQVALRPLSLLTSATTSTSPLLT